MSYRALFTRILSGLYLVLVLSASSLFGQGNCLRYPEGSKERKACEYGYEAISYKQGSRTSQLLFDSAIALNPNYAWAYYQKAVPYLKRGLLQEGMQLLDKAVELEPNSYLTYRAYWYFQHQSYTRCLEDLENFYNSKGSYLAYTPGGGMNMRILMGVAYAYMGETKKAIKTIETGIAEYPSPDFEGLYDYHTLGVAYLLDGNPETSIQHLTKSLEANPLFADTYYYLSEAEGKRGDPEKVLFYLHKAVERYNGEVEGGYTGYPFCFPVPGHIAEEKLKSLL